MGDEETEAPPPYEVQVTASFSLVKRDAPPAPPPPVEGEEGADLDAAPAEAEAEAELPPGIENVLFSFSMGEPFTQELKSEPLSVAFPVAEEEGGEVPPMPNWAEQVSWTQTEGLLFQTSQEMAQPALLAGCCRVAVISSISPCALHLRCCCTAREGRDIYRRFCLLTGRSKKPAVLEPLHKTV